MPSTMPSAADPSDFVASVAAQPAPASGPLAVDTAGSAPSWVADPAQLDELAARLLGLTEEPSWQLAVPAQVADEARQAGVLIILDPEGARAGLLHVAASPPPAAEPSTRTTAVHDGPVTGPRIGSTAQSDLVRSDLVTLHGQVEPAGDSGHGVGRPLWRSPAQAAAELGQAGVLAVTDRPLLRADLDQLRASTAAHPGPLVIVVTVAHRGTRLVPPEATLAAVTASARSLGRTTWVLPVPIPGQDPATRAALADRYSAALGTPYRLDLATTQADRMLRQVADRLDRGEPLGDLLDPRAAAILRRARPPLHRRGVVLLLTGLSGSGKSTIARALRTRILVTTNRTVTLLDGDVVRRLLSAGLGFSRSDRELNLARIGFVAAEAARHGGLALCAPIAPYAASRELMRQFALDAGADFVLVWVSTPLAECERRDRKGLYAKARAGEISFFTGISDPYEPPTDADLILDTTDQSPSAAADTVLTLLRSRGYLRESDRAPENLLT